jgi:hypothetical protein
MTKMVGLEYRVNEDLHTLAYKRDMEAWLKQWTVANNLLLSICYTHETVVGDEPSKAEIQPLFYAARDTLVAQHIDTLRRVFPEHTKIDRNYAEDFRFRFEVYMAESGKPMKYLPFM